MSFDIPADAVLVGPSDEAISEARHLADSLVEIATDESHSQSDRLVRITARLGQISGLLRHRFVVPENHDA